MAKTIANGIGMTNAWLREQSTLSLKMLRADLRRFAEPPDADPHVTWRWC